MDCTPPEQVIPRLERHLNQLQPLVEPQPSQT
jgi:hypothetical protein